MVFVLSNLRLLFKIESDDALEISDVSFTSLTFDSLGFILNLYCWSNIILIKKYLYTS